MSADVCSGTVKFVSLHKVISELGISNHGMRKRVCIFNRFSASRSTHKCKIRTERTCLTNELMRFKVL